VSSYGLKPSVLHGEAGLVDETAVAAERERCMAIIAVFLNGGHTLADVYNADETGLFTQCVPERIGGTVRLS
jgi:hypothetical protein